MAIQEIVTLRVNTLSDARKLNGPGQVITGLHGEGNVTETVPRITFGSLGVGAPILEKI